MPINVDSRGWSVAHYPAVQSLSTVSSSPPPPPSPSSSCVPSLFRFVSLIGMANQLPSVSGLQSPPSSYTIGLLLLLLASGSSGSSSDDNNNSTEVEQRKLDVRVYYETLCSDSHRFFTQQLNRTWPYRMQNMNLQLVPYGKAFVSRALFLSRPGSGAHPINHLATGPLTSIRILIYIILLLLHLFFSTVLPWSGKQ